MQEICCGNHLWEERGVSRRSVAGVEDGEEDSGMDIGVSLGRVPVTGLSPRTGVHLCPCANNGLGVAHRKYEFGTELWWIWSMATNQGSWWCKFTALGSQASSFRGAGSFSSLTLCIVRRAGTKQSLTHLYCGWGRKVGVRKANLRVCLGVIVTLASHGWDTCTRRSGACAHLWLGLEILI